MHRDWGLNDFLLIQLSSFFFPFQMNMPLQNTKHPALHLPTEIRYVPEEVMGQKV